MLDDNDYGSISEEEDSEEEMEQWEEEEDDWEKEIEVMIQVEH